MTKAEFVKLLESAPDDSAVGFWEQEFSVAVQVEAVVIDCKGNVVLFSTHLDYLHFDLDRLPNQPHRVVYPENYTKPEEE